MKCNRGKQIWSGIVGLILLSLSPFSQAIEIDFQDLDLWLRLPKGNVFETLQIKSPKVHYDESQKRYQLEAPIGKAEAPDQVLYFEAPESSFQETSGKITFPQGVKLWNDRFELIGQSLWTVQTKDAIIQSPDSDNFLKSPHWQLHFRRATFDLDENQGRLESIQGQWRPAEKAR